MKVVIPLNEPEGVYLMVPSPFTVTEPFDGLVIITGEFKVLPSGSASLDLTLIFTGVEESVVALSGLDNGALFLTAVQVPKVA